MLLRPEEHHQRCRFTKSYKYKHKPPQFSSNEVINAPSCDPSSQSRPDAQLTRQVATGGSAPHQQTRPSPSTLYIIAAALCLHVMLTARTSQAFCPSKCLCNDHSLSANCTQVSSISIVPMTLNPLLKHLTLNQLPMWELSNSLSVYRQLEHLNLNGNQLRQIKYENFNFKSAPSSLLIHHSHLSAGNKQTSDELSSGRHYSGASNQELNANNELLARRLKHTLDKSGPAEDESGLELRLHLRELHLDDNRIEQLGEASVASDEESPPESASLRLKSAELERLAPFLTLVRLRSLSLAGNRLSRLQQHAFLGLVQLRHLDLSRNGLEFIDRHALVGLIELRVLRLAQNRLARHLQHLGTALCRAPTNELRALDLSDQSAVMSRTEGESQELVLPNQMFLCAPRLSLLRLDGLHLRHIQVNAFDNLQQLEILNLSRNYLEQVPSDSLSYSNSNVSLSLRQLDLSDTLIEFVSANSFGRLKNLQKLCMNSMKRLVSFDLASFSVHYGSPTGPPQLEAPEPSGNIEQLTRSDAEFKAALKQLLPEHLFERVSATQNQQFARNQHISMQPSAQNQQQQQIINQPQQLINEHLIELQLRHNHRLQSVHSSLSLREELPRGKVRFVRLRLLDLTGAAQLQELALDWMLELEGGELGVDLSSSSSLNCSSCHMGWLLEAARGLRHQRAVGWPMATAPEVFRVALVSPDKVRCGQPAEAPLTQLVELESAGFAPPLLGHCRQWGPLLLRSPPAGQPVDNSGLPPVAGSAQAGGPLERAASWAEVATAGLCLLMLLLLLGKLALVLTDQRRGGRAESRWFAPAANGFGIACAGSADSPSSSTSAHCSSSSTVLSVGAPAGPRPTGAHAHLLHKQPVFAAAGSKRPVAFSDVGQIERRLRAPANLFSRIAERWRGCRLQLPGSSRLDRPPASYCAREQVVSRRLLDESLADPQLQAAANQSAKSCRLALHAVGDASDFIKVAQRHHSDELANSPAAEFVYANCQPLARQLLASQQLRAIEADLARARLSPPPAAPFATLRASTCLTDGQVHQQQRRYQDSSAPDGGSNSRPGEPHVPDFSHGGGEPFDSHIYVTLDRPIKQEDKCAARRPQQQRLRERKSAPEAEGSKVKASLGQRAPDDYKSFEWPPREVEFGASDSCLPASRAEAGAGEPLKVEDEFKLAEQLNHRLHEEQFASPLSKLSAPIQSPPDRQPHKQTGDGPGTFAKNVRHSALTDRKQWDPSRASYGGSGDNVTGHPDESRCSDSTDCGAPAPRQRQLSEALNGPADGELASEEARDKYDANHAAPAASIMAPCDDDYAINGLDSRQAELGGSDWTASRAPGGRQQQRQRQLPMGGAAAGNRRNNVRDPDHRLIGQQNCVALRGGGSLNGLPAAAGNGLPVTAPSSERHRERLEAPEALQPQQQRRGPLAGARLPPAVIGLGAQLAPVCREQLGQQHFCDMSASAEAENQQTAAETIISQLRPTLGPSPRQNRSELGSRTLGRAQVGSHSNEIYSNQFYYCKPSRATLSRPKSGEKS